MDLSALLTYIDRHINTKVGVEKITGPIHNAVLKEVVNSLIEITGTGFGGNIAPNGNPGSQTKPIYFMADATGTYTYCGGVQVALLPAFIVWNGTTWSVKEFGIPQGVGDPSQCQGLTKAADPQPQGKKVGDWYVFLGGGSLNWTGATKDAPGIVYLDRFEMVGGNNTAMWEIVAFGEGGGGEGLTPAQVTMLESFTASFSFSGIDSFPLVIGRKVRIDSITKSTSITELRVGKNGDAPTDITPLLPLTIEAADELVFEATYNRESNSHFTLIGVKL